jgi:hypothetical protein
MNQNDPNEPSVLDFLKSRLAFRRSGQIEIPPAPEPEPRQDSPTEGRQSAPGTDRPLPWRALGALLAALLAQHSFEPPDPAVSTGIALYLIAFALLCWAILGHEWDLAPLAETEGGNDPLTVRWLPFVLSAILLIPAFILFGGPQLTASIAIPQPFHIPGLLVTLFHLKDNSFTLQDNLFTWWNVTVWLLAVGLFVWSLWLSHPQGPGALQRLREWARRESWQLQISRWTVLILLASLVVIFFRVYHIQQTPAEPFSDHAEKLLDVYDVTQGQTHIFFPRNTGREAIQFYWTVLMNWIFGTGLSFLTLKIDTVGFGLFTLPYVYLLGKEIASRRVGLLAMFLTGVGYWPNVISRIGLRFPLYPLFVAPTMLYLIRGLRTRNRNDFILSGIFLGIGLHGYSPSRIVPVLVVAAIALYILHAQAQGARRDALLWLAVCGLASFFVFLPLFRYMTDNPDMFFFRALSRVSTTEQPLPGPAPQIFASNVWNGLRMMNWDDGNVWVNSVPHRPALDIVTGALFLIGIVLVLVRYLQKRHWLDAFLLISIPILQLPSTLSLAFPDENPATNRAGGAIIPVFIIVALALDGLILALGSSRGRQALATVITLVLLIWSAAQSYDLVFNTFDQQFRDSAWNSSDMGEVIKEFGLIYGETDTVWIVPFPYWVDTRLPGVWAGIPNRDFAVFPDHLADTLPAVGPKLFMVKADLTNPQANDQTTLDLLRAMYPQGSLSLHHSPVPGRDFWIYFVPAPVNQ